jgi:glycosyltransferase involved in cell wall biosynthesis
MYGYWKRAESGATKLLPKYFWHWGEDSVQDSIKYVSKSYLERHQHLAMGNPWSSKWVNSSMNNFVSNGSKKFLKHIDKYKARLLISLQPIVDPLPKHLMIALNSLGPDYFVMFRLHPAMTSEKNKHADELARKLRVKHDIYFSSSTPLYALLKSCDLHLTAFSSVVYEAWAVGVPTIVYDRRGLELYKAEITDNKIFYAATSTSLKSQIEKVVSKRSKLKKQSYITLDHLTIKRNLKNLLNEID